MKLHNKYTKKEILGLGKRFLMIAGGCFILALGIGVFLVPLNIVAGGLSGIGLIIDYYIHLASPDFMDTVDITVFILSWLLFFLGLFLLGKKFTIQTLIATIIYPLMLILVYRLPFFTNISEQLIAAGGASDTGTLILAGFFGGALAGLGCTLTFLAGGSTGGVDVLYFIFYKYFHIKQSITSFAIDAIVILLGMIFIPNNFVPCLVGIFSAIISAMTIQFIYEAMSAIYIADIISTKWEDISVFVQNEIGRGVTYFDTVGGFSGEKKRLVRVVFERRQIHQLKEGIAKIDPNAFMTYCGAKVVYGEGFTQLSHLSHTSYKRVYKIVTKDEANKAK
jgi:uncharacterized membrane-anchored protein YitT (DUF2179 family)